MTVTTRSSTQTGQSTEVFEHSWESAHAYPTNLVWSDLSRISLESIRKELLRQAPRLFCTDGAASVGFMEMYDGVRGFEDRTALNQNDLHRILRRPMAFQSKDPLCRFVFLSAPNSRDPLNITLRMMQLLLAYHQVMPTFLEHLSAFGFREYAQDCALTSFHSEDRLTDYEPGLQLPELGRSGFWMEHCYSLKSVERAKGQLDWPWSVRQCAIYHTLDLETAQATWIVIKANRCIEKLIREKTGSDSYCERLQNHSFGGTLLASLEIHELVATWSCENWQWYINFLETTIQEITRPALSVTMEEETLPSSNPQFAQAFTHSPRQTGLGFDIYEEKPSALRRTMTSLRTYSRALVPSTSQSSSKEERGMVERSHRFSFKDLPKVHSIEERANETLDVLANNDEVLEVLKDNYKHVVSTLGADTLTDPNKRIMKRSLIKIGTVQKRVQMQQSRVKKLLRLLADRKALIQGIIDYEAMEANRLLAEKATVSANNMELIANKTELETVSMRIITLVTLFFLPGTFISTLMSTPIVTFDSGSPSISDRDISAGALEFYMAVSLPLMVLTFAAWGGVYWWETRKQKKRHQAQASKSSLPLEA